MANLTADNINLGNNLLPEYLVGPVKAAEKIYQNAFLSSDTSGRIVNASDTAGDTFRGLAYEPVDNTSGGDGDEEAHILPPKRIGHLKCKAVNPDATWLGQLATVSDNQTVKLGGSVVMGTIEEVQTTGADGMVLVNLERRTV